ncbi:MAG: F-box protein [Alphaproteobacteria bacterium]|nr:F-box protein [Alphaproteobacteria bacterium]
MKHTYKKAALAITLSLLSTPSFSTDISVLPEEILVDIFKKLDVKANVNIQEVSKQFRQLACDEQVKKTFQAQFCTTKWPVDKDEYYNLEENALFVLNDQAAPMLIKLKAAHALQLINMQRGNKPKASEYAQKFVELYNSADKSIKQDSDVYDSYFMAKSYK